MAEFDFSMDPGELNKKIEAEASKIQKGVDNLKKYERGLSEQERIIHEIAKKRVRLNKAAAIAAAEAHAANAPRPSPFQAGWNENVSPFGMPFHGTGVPTQWPEQEQPTLPRDRSRGGPRGRSPFEKEAGYGSPASAVVDKIVSGMASFMPAVAAFAAAVHTFGNMSIQAQQTRSENYKEVGDMKVRAQRAAKTLGLSEQDIMMSVTSASDPQQALGAYEAWAKKKRKTGIAPPKYAMAGLTRAANEGGIEWSEAKEAGMEGTWGRYTRVPGLEGEARDYNQTRRGVNAANYEAAAITWREDMEEAKDAAFSEAQWKTFQASHPWAANIPFARASREIRNRFEQEDLRSAYEAMPTGAGYGGAPPAAPQSPIQQHGVDVRSGGRGVPTVRIENTEAIRPRPQLDVRSGNQTAREN
jgi:hypothetical protein